MKLSFLLAGMGVALTLWIGYNYVHKPLQRQRDRVRAEIATERTRQETAASVGALLHQIEQYRVRLPEEPDPSWLVQEVMALAKDSGVQLTTISQETPQRFEQFTHLAVRIQLSATYHELGAFLDRIERANRFIRVESVAIPQPSSNQTRAQSIDVTLGTLYIAPGLNTVGGGSTLP